ncbi:TRAP transporter large permease [Thermodesulfobacteriota bacterium]
MSPIVVGLIGIFVLLFLLAIGMPIGFSMMLVGFVGFTNLVTFSGASHILAKVPYAAITNYDFCVIPLFFLMAAICLVAGFGKSLFKLAYAWIGRIPGGLSVATIGACAMFAAASASTIATALTIGKVAIPEMKAYKYDSRLACGCVAAGGTLGILIPPSGILIVYGIITEQSITKLFIGGIIPGIILSLIFMGLTVLWARLNPALAPSAPSTSMREKLAAIVESAEMVLLLLVVIVGLIVGWFTPTEAGAAGAFGAIVLSVIRKRLSLDGFIEAFKDTLYGAGMVFTILIGALIFNSFLAVSTIPMELASWVSGLGLPPVIIMVLILVVYLVLGCFIDAFSMVLLTIPIFYPVVKTLGFDPIWFGIVTVLVVEIALITPPVGMNVYVIWGISRDVPMEDIFKGIMPFLAALIIFIAFLVAFPQVVLFLPGLMN